MDNYVVMFWYYHKIFVVSCAITQILRNYTNIT